MPGISETRTFDALLSTTLAKIRPALNDNIFDDYVFLSYLNGKLGMALRGRSVKRVEDGGESIVEPLMYGMNTTAKSYSGAETLDTTLQEGITIARYDWKQYAGTIGITGAEERKNNSESAIIKLLDAKTKQAVMSLRDKMNVDAFGDGTGNSGKAMMGLSGIVSATSTLAGIDPAVHTWWVSTVNSSVGSFASGGLNAMRTALFTVSFGNDKPDLIITTQTVAEYYHKVLQPQERYTNTKLGNTGFENITFHGIPIVFDRDCSSGTMYMLNSNYLNFVVHKDADVEITPFQRPVNQDVLSAQMLFMGNLTTNNRRMHAKLSGITA